MLLLHITGHDEGPWARAFAEGVAPMPVVTRADYFSPQDIAYIFVWKPTPDAFDGLANLKAILSYGAGVDALMQHPRLPDVPVVRLVAEDLTTRMGEYVVSQVTMHQRLFTRFQADQRARRWHQIVPPLACDVSVGIMGMGVLGQHAAGQLKTLGFDLRAWSRSPKSVDGVETFAGTEEFDAFLSGTDILVNLLPLTPETEGILNIETFSKLRRTVLPGGPVVINAGRGRHQREDDIVRALTDGTLAAASLDVFEVEPLPHESHLWRLENCYITPHISASSTPQTCVNYFSKIIREFEAGKPLVNVVDRTRGY